MRKPFHDLGFNKYENSETFCGIIYLQMDQMTEMALRRLTVLRRSLDVQLFDIGRFRCG